MLTYLLILAVGFVAGAISGIIGTGSSIILLPVLVIAFGPLESIPVMAIASTMANLAKLLAWWRETDWRAVAAYALGGVPAAALGARTLIELPPRSIDLALGLFFLVMIPGRRWIAAREFHIRRWHLIFAGAFIGFLTGIVVSTGPLSVPVFTAYGLAKGAFLSTEAAASLALFISKLIVFREFGVLPMKAVFKGLLIGASVMAGAFAAKRIVLRLSPAGFRLLLDGVMLASAVALLWSALGISI